jgi:hypothetical protein
MTSSHIIGMLKGSHFEFTAMIASLSEEQFLQAEPGKWSPGQQLDHLVRSVAPLEQALNLPKFIPRMLFGKVNRPSRSYDEVVARYQDKLAQGGKASGKYVPAAVTVAQRDALIDKLNDLVEKLSRSLGPFTEQDLDTILLPHPLLGKLTLREMLYFTIYHVQHHHQGISPIN